MRIESDINEGIIKDLYLYLFPKGKHVKTVRDKIGTIASDIINFNGQDFVMVEYPDGTQDKVVINSLQLI